MRSNLTYRDVKHQVRELVEELFRQIPTGVGKAGRFRFAEEEMRQLLGRGSSYVIGRGEGVPRDLEFTEANGRLDGADPDAVSDPAVKRGLGQCGTRGSGHPLPAVPIVA